jgi:hypothetical protein
MPGHSLAGDHAGMGDGDTVVLRLEVVSGQEPVSGLVRVADEAFEFSGWSELFAVLQTLLAGSP